MSDRSIAPLHVEIRGTGFPLLCLHGHPGSAASLSVFTRHLSQRVRAIAPDLRGYGKSRYRGEFELGDSLLDLEALLDRLQIRRCLVLGWSLGGILAMELALRCPERVSGLILVATSARPRSNHPPASWQDLAYTGIASLANRVQPGSSWHIERFGKRSLYRYLISRHTAVAYRYLAREGIAAYLGTSGAARRALGRALKQGYDRLGDLDRITCPSLVLAGGRDRHITPESSLETARRLPQSQWRLYPDTAHLFPWEIPQQVLGDIDRWLDDHPDVVIAERAPTDRPPTLER